MSDQQPPKQLLHLVIGGELADLTGTEFKDLDKVELVGVYPELRHRLCRLEGQGAADRRQRPYALFHRPPAPPARPRRRQKARIKPAPAATMTKAPDKTCVETIFRLRSSA